MQSLAMWAAIALGGIGLIWVGPRLARPVLRLLQPMWLPILVLVLAAFALFGTDQGRDLGVGVLDAGHGELLLLALALLYWATGTWLAARLGLNRDFPKRSEWGGYTAWLRWLPRLLGVTVHLFAALTLSFAARYVLGEDAGQLIGPIPVWFLIFLPPVAIILGTTAIWMLDRQLAMRSGADGAAVAFGRLRRAFWLVPIGGLLVVGLLYLLNDHLPAGLARASLWVLASAVGFLLIVSNRRAIGEAIVKRVGARGPAWEQKLRDGFSEGEAQVATSSWGLVTGLALVGVGIGVFAWRDPVTLGWWLGSMTIAFLAFGAYIAVIELARLSCRSVGRFWAAVAALAVVAIGASVGRDYHRVRLCGDTAAPCPMPPSATSVAPGAFSTGRPTVAEAATAWHAQAAAHWPAGRPVPMLVVATAGGGLRAAQWTATVLERLEVELGPEVMRRHLFAISGVSGGSLGAMAYAAAVARDPASAARPTTFLDRDFLAPALAAAAFVDGPSSFLPEFGPEFGQRDRGMALELGWERASDGLLARPFRSFFPTLVELKAGAPWRPALLLNATHQDTGRRIVASHLQIERHAFLDTFDAHVLLGADLPASTAAHNSARFTYVSPAGKLVPRGPGPAGPDGVGFVLDGGYFENFGAITALQLVREVRRALETGPGHAPSILPIVLQISSDPSLSARDRARLGPDGSFCDPAPVPGFLPFQPGHWRGPRWHQGDGGGWSASLLNELFAPLAGVMAGRVAHGTLASQELAHAICSNRRMPATAAGAKGLMDAAATGAAADAADPTWFALPEFAHLAMCDDEPGALIPPLGWAISDAVARRFPEILERCTNREELARLTAVLRLDPSL